MTRVLTEPLGLLPKAGFARKKPRVWAEERHVSRQGHDGAPSPVPHTGHRGPSLTSDLSLPVPQCELAGLMRLGSELCSSGLTGPSPCVGLGEGGSCQPVLAARSPCSMLRGTLGHRREQTRGPSDFPVAAQLATVGNWQTHGAGPEGGQLALWLQVPFLKRPSLACRLTGE